MEKKNEDHMFPIIHVLVMFYPGWLVVYLSICISVYFLFLNLFPPPPSPEDTCVLNLCRIGTKLYMQIYSCFSLHH